MGPMDPHIMGSHRTLRQSGNPVRHNTLHTLWRMNTGSPTMHLPKYVPSPTCYPQPTLLAPVGKPYSTAPGLHRGIKPNIDGLDLGP